MSVRESVSLALCLFVRPSVPVCAPPGRVQRAVLEAGGCAVVGIMLVRYYWFFLLCERVTANRE